MITTECPTTRGDEAKVERAFSRAASHVAHWVFPSNQTSSSEIPQAALDFLVEYLGVEITKWYFRDEDTGRLRFFRDSVKYRGIDPPWFRIKALLGDGSFDGQPIPPAERQQLEAETSNGRSAERFCEWFLKGNWIRSKAEQAEGWILVSQAELILGSFLWYFFQALDVHFRNSAEARSAFCNDETHPIDGGFLREFERSDAFNTAVASALDQMKEGVCRGTDAKAGLQLAIGWLDLVLQSAPGDAKGESEFEQWFGQHPPCRFFTRLAGKNRSILVAVRTWNDLAMLLLECSDYDFRTNEDSDATMENLEHRLRFSPASENKLGTRNLLFFPVWLSPGQSLSSAVPLNAASYTPWVIAGFFDEQTILKRASLLRSIFILISTPSIIERGYQSTVERQITELMARAAGHDILHPLFETFEMIKIALEETPHGEDELRKCLLMAEETTRFSMLRAKNLLDSVRMRTINRQECDLGSLIEEAVSFVSRARFTTEKNVRIHNVSTGELLGCVDAEKIERCVENLLLNAVFAAGPHGHVKVWTKLAETTLRIHVADSGVGICQEARNAFRVMRPYTNKPTGSGVGLPATRHILRAHGGDLELDGEPISDEGLCGVHAVASLLIEDEKEESSG